MNSLSNYEVEMSKRETDFKIQWINKSYAPSNSVDKYGIMFKAIILYHDQ